MATATVHCPHCQAPIQLAMRGLGQDQTGREAIVQLDTKPFIEHLRACREQRPATTTPEQQPSKAVERHDSLTAALGTLIAPGTRACQMCGCTNVDCYAMLRDKGAACCSVCGNGNTHPTPRESMSCADWAADHGADV